MAEHLRKDQTLSGKTLLFSSLPRHDARYTSTPWQIAVQLAKNNTVIWIDHPFSFIQMFTMLKNPSVRKRLKAYFNAAEFEKDGVRVILPPFIWPVNFLPKGALYNFFSHLNHRMMARRMNSFFKRHEIKSLVYINSFNFYFPKLHSLLNVRKLLNVYHCIDPMVKAFTLKHGVYLQEQAAFNADIIISTAPELQKNFIRQGFQNSYLVPNAANFNLFSQTRTAEVHPRVANIKGKVIGYFGNIERRCNFKLLQGILNELQDWQLIMAGPVEQKYVPQEFFNDHRIHFTGPFPQEEAPSVIKRFDVAIIPFQCDEAGKGIYPLKLYEYLAAGKPVVSTNFNPEVLGQLKDTVYLGDTASEFANAVLLAYATDSKEKIRARQNLAAHHTWEHRAKVFGKLIEKEINPNEIEPRIALKNGSAKPLSLKERVKRNPFLKKLVLSLIFRPKPNGSRLRWYLWLLLIFPKYFRSGVNWGSRLDLTPFNKFKLGKYVRIEQGVLINNGMGDVFIHDEVHTGIGCIIIGPVTLHKHVGLSQYVRILGMHHGIDVRTPHHHQPVSRAPVILEEDAFIGTGTVIMGKKNGEPLVLGRYCRVGANSVVTTDIPPYSVAVGNPAKVIRVWDFETNTWIKPPATASETPHGVSAPKVRERIDEIDLSRIPAPKPDQAA